MNVWKDMRVPLVVSLVSTVDQHGRPNASPKTWWSPVSYDPPLCSLFVRPDSDTCDNILKTGVWILHLPSRVVAKEVLHTAKPLPHGECELDDVGLPWVWLEHQMLKHPMPRVENMPWVCCWAVSTLEAGDHRQFVGRVGIAGGFGVEDGVEEVVLHRGRNVFVALGPEFETEAY